MSAQARLKSGRFVSSKWLKAKAIAIFSKYWPIGIGFADKLSGEFGHLFPIDNKDNCRLELVHLEDQLVCEDCVK